MEKLVSAFKELGLDQMEAVMLANKLSMVPDAEFKIKYGIFGIELYTRGMAKLTAQTENPNFVRAETDKYGNHFYYNKDGHFHRSDGPAAIYVDGTQVWWMNGHVHRTDGPAYIGMDGTQEWFLNGDQFPSEAAFRQALEAKQ